MKMVRGRVFELPTSHVVHGHQGDEIRLQIGSYDGGLADLPLFAGVLQTPCQTFLIGQGAKVLDFDGHDSDFFAVFLEVLEFEELIGRCTSLGSLAKVKATICNACFEASDEMCMIGGTKKPSLG